MTQQVIIVERKKYAVGLFWQPLAAHTRPRNHAYNVSKTVDKKLNLFTAYRAMVGLGSVSRGHSAGMPAAAAEVMEAFAEFSSFLAVFRVGPMFWLVAVRNGIILQDELIETENAARAEYGRLAAMPDWGSVFAPTTWNVPRAIERRVEDVIAGNVKATLKTISRFRANFLSLLLLAAFIFGLGYLFHEPIVRVLAPKPNIAKIDPKLAAEYKKKIAEKNRELDKQFGVSEKATPKPLVMPYDLLPDPYARAQLCYQAIGFLMQPIPGWLQTTVQCNESDATVVFRRSFGNLADFYTVATDLMPGAFVVENSESEIRVTAKLPLLVATPSLETNDPDTIVRDVNTSFQRLATTVEINKTVDTIADATRSVNVNVIEIGATSKLTPPEFIKIFGDFDGVYMTMCGWDVRSRTWNYEVIIYAK